MMAEYTREQLEDRAERAKNLLADDLFAEMVTDLRMSALVELANTPISDTDTLVRLQCKANVAEELKDLLLDTILASGEKDGGVSMEVPRNGEEPTR